MEKKLTRGQKVPHSDVPIIGPLQGKSVKSAQMTHREFMQQLGEIMGFEGITTYFIVAARDTEQPCGCDDENCDAVNVRRDIRTGHNSSSYQDLFMLASNGLELVAEQWEEMQARYADEDT
jgi:hypothetical protein